MQHIIIHATMIRVTIVIQAGRVTGESKNFSELCVVEFDVEEIQAAQQLDTLEGSLSMVAAIARSRSIGRMR
jgi:hypothetical protein